MQYHHTIFLALILLYGCSNAALDTEENGQQDLEVEHRETILQLELQDDEVELQEYASKEEALSLSYDEAVKMQEMMTTLMPDMDQNLRNAILPVFNAFQSDVEALKYYVDLSEREPLLEEDERNIVRLSANIDEFMELFAEVTDRIL